MYNHTIDAIFHYKSSTITKPTIAIIQQPDIKQVDSHSNHKSNISKVIELYHNNNSNSQGE